jgi:phosphoribosylanthranilate isomerase
MRVKICGITNLADALAACDAGADALGFNFAEESKAKQRYIAPQAAAEIICKLPPFVTTVAVTVNDSLEQLREYLDVVDLVQLHGEEPPELCAAIAMRAIKVFRVGPNFRPEEMLYYPSVAYLLDASISGQRGGSGVTFDWMIARKASTLGKPVILAGGLTPENVREAIEAAGPQAVDTASGVESSPGKKDHERIRRFVSNAKAQLS